MTKIKGAGGRAPENIAGMMFNRLTAICIDKTKTNRVHWVCRCECGIEKSVAACDLKSSHTKSLGCFNTLEEASTVRAAAELAKQEKP